MLQIADSLKDQLNMDREVKINHLNCPSGTDTKERLYAKQTLDGVVMYCHHCGSKGFLRTPEKLHRISEFTEDERWTGLDALRRVDAKEYWSKSYSKCSDWPVNARLWWYSYELDEFDALVYGVRWCAQFARLFLRGSDDVYQGRTFTGTNKYITWKQSDQICHFTNYTRHVFIVEDLVSAYKIHKCGGDSLCLLGTKISDQMVAHVIGHYNQATVWLDNDIAGKTGALNIYARLNSVVNCATLNKEQPKEIPLEELRRIVNA